MVVIDHGGRLVYMGAIDDTPSTRLADIKTAHNYIAAALDCDHRRPAGRSRLDPRLRLFDQMQG
jgi:hypothetical protein